MSHKTVNQWGNVVEEFSTENDEFQTIREEGILYDFGDVRETLLSETLKNITGSKAKAMQRSARSINFTPLKAIGSSLENKPNLMISENPNQNK